MQSFAKPTVEQQFLGLNDALSAEALPPGYFTKIDNAFCSDNKIVKTTGSTAIATSIASRSFNGLAAFEKISSSNKWLVVSINGASNAQLYQSTGGNFSAIGSANLTNSKPVWFEVANDYLFGFNGSEVVDWDGTTVTKNRATLPLGFYAKWFHNYLFVGNVSATPNRIFWSDLGTPTNFTNTNFVDINPGDSDQIMGLAGFPGQDEMLVFKRNTIWSISGFSGASFNATTIATQNTNNRIFGYGTVAPFSIVSVGNDVYFFSMLGSTPVIRSLTKTINAVTIGGGIISDNIKTTMANITLSKLAQIVGTFDGRYVYWSVPANSSNTNNQLIVLDTWEINSAKNIYPFITLSGKNASYFAVSTIPGVSNIYFTDASATSGLVFKFDASVYTDNGTNITMDVRTRDYFQEFSRKTKWKYLYVTYQSGSAAMVNVNYKIDQGTNYSSVGTINFLGNSPGLGSFVLGTSRLGGSTTSTSRLTFAGVTCHNLGVQFTETSANAVMMHRWELYGKPRSLRAG